MGWKRGQSWVRVTLGKQCLDFHGGERCSQVKRPSPALPYLLTRDDSQGRGLESMVLKQRVKHKLLVGITAEERSRTKANISHESNALPSP